MTQIPRVGDWGIGLLFDAIKDAVIVADANTGRIVLWNRGAESLLQYTAAEALELRLEDLIPPALRERHKAGLAHFAQTGRGDLVDADTPVELPAVRKDGVQIIVQLTLSRLSRVSHPDGMYAMGLLRDVTKEHESDQIARLMLAAATQSVFAIDLQGRCTLANPAATATLGYDSAEELVGRDMHLVMHHSYPDGSPYPASACPIHDALHTGTSSTVDNEVFWRADGTPFSAQYHCEPIVRAATVLGAVVTFTDTAEQRLFRSAFDDAVVGMCLASPSGVFMRVNGTLAKMLGRSIDQLVGLRFADVTHPDDRERNRAGVEQVLAGKETSYQGEKRYLRPDGTFVFAAVSGRLVRDAAGQPLHFIVQMLDITEQRALAAQRDATSAMLDGIVQNSQSLVYVKDLDGTYLLANQPFLDAFSVTEEDLLGQNDTWLDATLEPVWRVNDLMARDGAYRMQEWSGHGEDRRWYESVKFPLHDGDGELYATCGVSLEVTELHRQREEASRAAAFSAGVLAASPDAIVINGLASGSIVYQSRTAEALLGGRSHLGPGGVAQSMVHPEDRNRLQSVMVGAGDLKMDEVLQVRYRCADGSGGYHWLSRRVTPFRRDEDSGVLEVLSVIRDISDMVAAEEQLNHAALHDPLTGLPNRTLLADRLAGALARARRQGQQVAVLFCDLDGFKRINDTAGHSIGDAVLRHTAERLRDVLREQDTVARVGGDEFVLVLEPREAAAPGEAATALQLAEEVAGRVGSALSRPIIFEGNEYVVTASIGIAFAGGATDVETQSEDVLRDADAAMYRAKARGKDRFEVYDAVFRADLSDRARIEGVLRHAGRATDAGVPAPASVDGTLAVAYQPIYDNDTSELLGFEALARLTDGDGEAIPPELFISVAEDAGLIRPLGMQVLRQACRQLARWRSEHPARARLSMAVNLSARQAHHPALAEEILGVLADERLSPEFLVLELTESVLMYAGPSTITTFRALRAAGIGIAIDDFGTGYASLRYLAELPVSAVKVDRSFTAGLPGNKTSSTIVRAVAGLALDLQLDCVVEGVETQQQRDALPPGVLVQGYLLGRPADAARVEQTFLAGYAASQDTS